MSDEEEKDLEEISEEEQHQMLVEQLAAGDTTLNEVREDLGLPPLVGGDVSMNPAHHKAAPPKPPQMIMFDRYFMSLGRPMHHKAGMLAYKNTKGKKTREAWKALFKDY